ncbi:MAG: AAA family ATPase, partial [Actinobacteria bacterium]|nr:AAA family ATPase [Actinomycetota bacterium]
MTDAPRALIVSGKGGTGKTTVAAALAFAAVGRGLRTLLLELEGRAGAAPMLGLEPTGLKERETPFGFSIASVGPREALLEYLGLFYGMTRLAGPLLRSRAVEAVTEVAPGFRDLMLAGKLYETADWRRRSKRAADRARYDLVVADAPPTGQIVPFLSAPAAFAEIIRVGRPSAQAHRIDAFLREGARHAAGAGDRQPRPPSRRTPARPRGRREADRRGRRRAGGFGGAAGLVLRGRGRGRRRPPPPPIRGRAAHAGSPPPRHRTRGASRSARLADRPERARRLGRPPERRLVKTLAKALDGAHVVVVTGPGGVGKTTTSAAIALRLAEKGHRTIVLTVDPARRLAMALGLPAIAGDRTRIRGVRGGTLDAMQLDTKRALDELVAEQSASEEQRDRILANRFYQRIADTLSGTSEYMAMEKLHALAAEGAYDAIVIDTPPTRSALSFLDAPRRLTDFLGGRFLRFVLAPSAVAGRGTLRVTSLGAQAFVKVIRRVAGGELLADTAEFLGAFEGMYGGFK